MNTEQYHDAQADVRTESERKHQSEMRTHLANVFCEKPARELINACFEATGEDIAIDLDEEEMETILTKWEVRDHLCDLDAQDLETFYLKERDQ